MTHLTPYEANQEITVSNIARFCRNSKDRDVPRGLTVVAKAVLTTLLVVLALTDMVYYSTHMSHDVRSKTLKNSKRCVII